jgi:hypothetical protein
MIFGANLPASRIDVWQQTPMMSPMVCLNSARPLWEAYGFDTGKAVHDLDVKAAHWCAKEVPVGCVDRLLIAQM